MQVDAYLVSSNPDASDLLAYWSSKVITWKNLKEVAKGARIQHII